jgi:alpha-1,6-mannosyltransferase
VKKAGVLTASAFFCAAYLSVALVGLGIDKFDYILAGGKKFATFPDLGSQIAIGSSYVLLAILYLVWFFDTKKPSIFWRFSDIMRNAAGFLLLAFVAYPLGNDVYLYLHAGLMNLSQVNPFLTRAGVFVSQLSPFVDWGQTSTYGPVSQFFFTLSAAVLTIDPILAVYTFKLFCLGLHILNGYLIWQLLPPIDPEESRLSRHKITIAYLINPLLLMEQVASAHVDVLISTSLIVLVASLARQRYWVGVGALWAGFLSKTLPLIWMPLVAVFLIRQKRWQLLIQAILASVGLIALLSVTALPGLQAWSSLLNPGVTGQYQSSLHTIAKFGLDLVRIFAPTTLTISQQQEILIGLARITLVGFAGFYSWVTWQTYRRWNYSQPDLVEDIGWVTLVLLLFATPWLMPWYGSILLTIAALIPRSRLFGLTSLAFGFSSSAQYLLQGHASLRSLISIGIPTLVLLVGANLLSRQKADLPGAIVQTEQPDARMSERSNLS